MDGGYLLADIPPELMQEPYDISVYVCDADGTLHSYFIPVVERPKPESYIYEPVEILRYESLAKRIAALEKGGVGGVALDTTLTQSGKAADAKATGDEIKRVEGLIPSIDGLAKTEDIPTKPEDIGAQPKGDYLTKAPVESVNGKTGAVKLSASDVGALPNTYTPPDQTAEQVGADPAGTALTVVGEHNVDPDSHNDIRGALKALSDRLTAFFDSDDQALDELSEIVAYIKSNKSLLDGITTSKVSVADIVNNLTTNVANRPLSAAQGVEIKALIDGLSTGKLDASKLTEAINTALAQAKASGEFDGPQGDTGEDGVSPTVEVSTITGGHRITITDATGTKNVDVMDGEDGDPGTDGRGIKSIARTSGNGAAGSTDTYTITYTDGSANTFTVRNGSNGATGQAATLEITGVTALEYGAAPTVTEQSGSTAQTRKYVVGIPAGKSGADGRTPVRGKDYWTPDDIAAIEADIATELARRGQLKPEFANSIEECTDTSKLYVLPDGYIYAYMLIEREVETGGGYTNLANPSSNDWWTAARIGSDGTKRDLTGNIVTNPITLQDGDVVRVKNLDIVTANGSNSSFYCGVYNTSGGVLSVTSLCKQTSYFSAITESVTGGQATATGAWVVRFAGKPTGSVSDIILTINEEITEGGTEIITEYAWANTGHAFVPTDYEERIIELEEDVLRLKNTVGTQGGSTGETVTLPAYWEPEVEAKAAIVKAHQKAGGKNCVSFVHAADLHIDDNDNGRTTDIGKVIATMLDRCHIPWAVLSGDINTRASYSTEAGLLEAQSAMPEHLAPLWGTNRLLLGLGNHDGCWGDSSGYYRHQFPPERMWDIFFRWQALDSRRVFSDDGLYFYVDNVAQKTRFIVLNSNFGGEYAEDNNGWAVNNRFATSCYGQAQLDWLADVALDMPDGYGAVLCAHVPPNITYTVDRAQLIGIVDAYNGRTQFSGDCTTGVDGWSNSSVSVDFSGAKGEIIAMFTGHVHGDSIDSTTMSCPIITILSAGASANEAYADTAPTRTPGTATETSLDVVTINRKTRMIYCTRVGAGDNREVGY